MVWSSVASHRAKVSGGVFSAFGRREIGGSLLYVEDAANSNRSSVMCILIFLSSNVTVQGTRHLVEGTLQPIVRLIFILSRAELHLLNL